MMTQQSELEVILTRRAVLLRGAAGLGALGLLPALAACGGNGEEAGETGAASGLSKQQVQNASGQVRALVWQGYEDQKVHPGLGSVSIKSGYLTQNEDVLTKSRVGGRAQYDTLTIFQGYIDPLMAIDAIEPIDESLLSNWQLLFDRFQSDEAFRREGKLYSVPYLWGTMQVNYIADKVDAPASFDDLMDSSLRGKIGLNDDTYSAITQFARFAGAENPNHLTPDEFDATFELLDKFRPQVAGILAGPEVTGMLIRGEAVITTPDWTPSLLKAREAGLDVQATMPALTFVDGWLRVKGGENEAAVYKLMNEAISTEAQAEAGNTLGLGVVNRDAVAELPTEVQEAWPYDDVDSLLDEAPAYPGVPVESDEFATLPDWVKRWEDYKASI
jgi:spermidine/putrescine transport system substrate-binding protein